MTIEEYKEKMDTIARDYQDRLDKIKEEYITNILEIDKKHWNKLVVLFFVYGISLGWMTGIALYFAWKYFYGT